MTGSLVEQEGDDQYERTLLAWRRTALSLVAAGLFAGHLTVADLGESALVVLLTGVAVVVAVVWLGGARQVGATGLALVVGVALLGVLALLGIAAR